MYKTTVKTSFDNSDVKYSVVDRSRNRLYVLCEDLDHVLVVNISTNIVVDKLDISPDGSHLVIDSSNSKLYITCSTKDIYVYDLTTRTMATNSDPEISSTFQTANERPKRIYLNESENKMYIFCANGKFDIYQISDLTLISSHTVGEMTYGETFVAPAATTTTTFAPTTSEYAKLLVSDNTSTGAVQVVEFPSKTVTALSSAKSYPERFVVDTTNDKVYLSNKSSEFIQVIDSSNNITNIPVPIDDGGIAAFDIDEENQLMFIVDNNNDVLLVMDLSDNSIKQRVNIDEFSIDCVFDKKSKQLYIFNMENKSFTLVDTISSPMVTQTLGLGFEPLKVQLDPARRKIYILSNESNAVYVLDIRYPESLNISLLFNCYRARNILLDQKNEKMYACLSEDDTIVIFDIKNHRIIKYLTGLGGSPRGLALDEEAKRLYVSNTRSGTISIVNTINHTIAETINSVGTVPYDLALSAQVTTTATPTTLSPVAGAPALTIPVASNQISSANKYLVFIGSVGDQIKFNAINTSDGYSVATQYEQDSDPSLVIDETIDIILYISNSPAFRICAATAYVTQDRPFQIISGSNTYNSTFGAGSVVSGSTRRIDLS